MKSQSLQFYCVTVSLSSPGVASTWFIVSKKKWWIFVNKSGRGRWWSGMGKVQGSEKLLNIMKESCNMMTPSKILPWRTLSIVNYWIKIIKYEDCLVKMWFCGFVCKSISNKKLHFHSKKYQFFLMNQMCWYNWFFLNEKCKKSKLFLISSKCLNWFTFVFLLIFGFWCKNTKKIKKQ